TESATGLTGRAQHPTTSQTQLDRQAEEQREVGFDLAVGDAADRDRLERRGVPVFRPERLLDEQVIVGLDARSGRNQPTVGDRAEHAVVRVDPLPGERAELQQLPADRREGPAIAGHLELAARWPDRLGRQAAE